MSPLDDELRAALQGRARALPLPADPLAGIERRAKRIQRNRVGAAVAGSALAVAMIALAVPAVQGATSAPQPDVPRYGTTQSPDPSPDPSAVAGRPAAAVPWGEPLDPDLDQAYLQQWEALNGRPAGSTQGEVLFRGQTNDGDVVHAYQLWFDAETAYAVVAHSGHAGPEVVRGTVLEPGTVEIDAVVPTKQRFPALVVVHDPALPTVQYAPDGRTFTTVEDDDDTGVITERTGPTGREADRVRLLDPAGEVAHDAAVFVGDDAEAPGTDSGEPPAGLDPEQPWEVRGDRSLVSDADLQTLGADWAQRHGVDAAQVVVRPLHVQRWEVDGGIEVVYLVRFKDNPWMWGVSSLNLGRWSWYAENELAPGATALAAALPGDEGAERLLVVGAPSLGGAVYAAAPGEFAPMDDVAPGVFVTTIRPGDPDDRFKVVDGDGNLDDPLFEGPAPDFQNAG